MKVGQVSTFNCRCGIATYCGMLTNALQDLGAETYVLAEECSEKDIVDFKFKTDYERCWNRNLPYHNVIRQSIDYDILHIQHQFGLFPNPTNNAELYDLAQTNIVSTLHDVVPPSQQAAPYMKPFLEKSKQIIVHTKACYELLQQWGFENPALIPHGTKLMPDTPKEEARKAVGLPENAKILLSWGFIWESKGILDLVRILAEVKKTIPEAMLVHAGGIHPAIAGSEYLRSILKTAIHLKLSPKDIVITQWVPEEKVSTYLSSADVIVLNYMRGSASASGAAHIALGSHRPLVKTNDFCLEEIPGLTSERGNSQQLCENILKVLQNVKLQQTLVACAEKASEEMSWANVAKQHLDVYTK